MMMYKSMKNYTTIMLQSFEIIDLSDINLEIFLDVLLVCIVLFSKAVSECLHEKFPYMYLYHWQA